MIDAHRRLGWCSLSTCTMLTRLSHAFFQTSLLKSYEDMGVIFAVLPKSSTTSVHDFARPSVARASRRSKALFNSLLVMQQVNHAKRMRTPRLFLGFDTHAVSAPAFASSLEVWPPHDVEVVTANGEEYTSIVCERGHGGLLKHHADRRGHRPAHRVQEAAMTTVHAYTSSQSIVDGPSKGFRRGRLRRRAPHLRRRTPV